MPQNKAKILKEYLSLPETDKERLHKSLLTYLGLPEDGKEKMRKLFRQLTESGFKPREAFLVVMDTLSKKKK